MTAMQEFVVPKSMPKTFAIKSFSYTASSDYQATVMPSGRIWQESLGLLTKTKKTQVTRYLNNCANGDAMAQWNRVVAREP
jgi:hypothetical protein